MNNSIRNLVESMIKNILTEKTNQRIDGYISSLNSKTDDLKDKINSINWDIHQLYELIKNNDIKFNLKTKRWDYDKVPVVLNEVNRVRSSINKKFSSLRSELNVYKNTAVSLEELLNAGFTPYDKERTKFINKKSKDYIFNQVDEVTKLFNEIDTALDSFIAGSVDKIKDLPFEDKMEKKKDNTFLNKYTKGLNFKQGL